MRVALRFVLLAPFLLALGGCFNFGFLGFGTEDSVPAAERQLSASTQALLAIKGMKQEAPIFVRIFKEESEFEVWKFKDGRFQHFRTYPICAWSGGLGPKVQQGDRQAPEGFYTVSRGQMNPHSLYHLAFNIGFPNAYDLANGHSGSALMVHGDCKSAGCYAMTDAYIEEIYILAREAFNAGQTRFHVQALPFHMTASNMQRHRDSPWYPFWAKLKEGHDAFEASGRPPVVKVCSKQYMVNVSFAGQAEPGPSDPCPASYAKLDPAAIPSIDGVPSTVVAGLSRGEIARTRRNRRQSWQQASRERHRIRRPQRLRWICQPRQSFPAPLRNRRRSRLCRRQRHLRRLSIRLPALLTWGRAPVVQARGVPSATQPVNYQTLPAPVAVASQAFAASTVQTAPAPDPNALQKLNRSGKGGKLPGDQSATALSIGDAPAAEQR